MATSIDKDVYQIIRTSPLKNKGEMIGLYTVLVSRRDYETNLAKISYKYINENLSWSKEKIAKIIKQLKEVGVIDYVSGNSDGYSNLYCFPLEKFAKGKESKIPDYIKNSTKVTENRKTLTQEQLLGLEPIGE